jgi:hypothetical protein
VNTLLRVIVILLQTSQLLLIIVATLGSSAVFHGSEKLSERQSAKDRIKNDSTSEGLQRKRLRKEQTVQVSDTTMLNKGPQLRTSKNLQRI